MHFACLSVLDSTAQYDTSSFEASVCRMPMYLLPAASSIEINEAPLFKGLPRFARAKKGFCILFYNQANVDQVRHRDFVLALEHVADYRRSCPCKITLHLYGTLQPLLMQFTRPADCSLILAGLDRILRSKAAAAHKK